MKSSKCSLSVVTIVLVLSFAQLSGAERASAAPRTPARRSLAGLHSRCLLQDESTTVYTVDFEDLAQQGIATGNHQFKEIALRGALPLHDPTQFVQYGAYDLTPAMVGELTTVVVEQLVRFRTVHRDRHEDGALLP